MSFDVANEVNSWRQTNNSFLDMIQNRLLQQHMTIAEQNNQLKMQEIAQASLNTKYSTLQCEQIQLKVKLEETQVMLKSAQNEKEVLKSLYENLHAQTVDQVGLAIQPTTCTETVDVKLVESLFQICKENSAKLDVTYKILQTAVSDTKYISMVQANNCGDGPVQETVDDLIGQDVKSLTECPVSESEKQKSLHIGGLEGNVKHADLMKYFSKYGTVVKVIMAKSNKAKRKALVVFAASLPELLSTDTFNGQTYSKMQKHINEFVENRKLKMLEVVYYSPSTNTQVSSVKTDTVPSCSTRNDEGSVTSKLTNETTSSVDDVTLNEQHLTRKLLPTEDVTQSSYTLNNEPKLPMATGEKFATFSSYPLSESEKQRSIFVGGEKAEMQPDEFVKTYSGFGTISKVLVETTKTSKALVVFSDTGVRDNIGTAGHMISGQVAQVSTNSNTEHFNHFQNTNNINVEVVEYPLSEFNPEYSNQCSVNEIEKHRSIYVNGFPTKTQHNDLRQYFSQFGLVTKIVLAIVRRKKALIIFEEPGARQLASPNLNHAKLMKNFEKLGKGEIETIYEKSSLEHSAQLTSTETRTESNDGPLPTSETSAILTPTGESSPEYITQLKTNGDDTKSPDQLPIDEKQRTILLSGWKDESKLATHNDLMHHFATYGKIVNVGTLANHPTQKFVTFDTTEACEKSLKAQEHVIWKGDQLVGQFVSVRPFTDEQDLNDKERTQKNDTFICQLCQSEQSVQSRIVFNPCGHGACDKCAAQMEKCHICKIVIESKIKQFE